uniref:Uncharacterized protein n=1 Tax=Anopheles albimanus TaxID=7167 RepID=A0A182FXQ6_ANOAL
MSFTSHPARSHISTNPPFAIATKYKNIVSNSAIQAKGYLNDRLKPTLAKHTLQEGDDYHKNLNWQLTNRTMLLRRSMCVRGHIMKVLWHEEVKNE